MNGWQNDGFQGVGQGGTHWVNAGVIKAATRFHYCVPGGVGHLADVSVVRTGNV